MNYCLIDDAWSNVDSITKQFKLYENPFDEKNIMENFKDIMPQQNTTPNQYNNTPYNNTPYNNTQNQYNNTPYNNTPYNNTPYNNTENQYNNIPNQSNTYRQYNNTYKQHYNNNKCMFTCDDFWEHINKCSECRNKIRKRFSSKLIETLQNIIMDNKDNIVLVLILLFILVFFNLLLSVFRK